MSYKLLRAMKVQCADGSIEQRQPGDLCPEADTWPNPGIWVKRGYLVPVDATPTLGLDRGKLKAARPSTEEDIARGKNSPVPQPGVPLPELGDLPKDKKADLMSLRRGDLEALAEEHGIAEPGRFSNKSALADAILAATVDLGPDDPDLE